MGSIRLITLLIATGFFVGHCSAQVPESAFDKDPWPMAKKGPVKIFVLAGQSNMQGHAALRTLEYLIYNEKTAKEYQQWKDRWGNWYERSDVWIWTTDGKRYGNLKPGFGQSEFKIGPELGFGWVMGEHFDEQVLLIKTCWGGRSVKKDFLPPSAERPGLGQVLQRRIRAGLPLPRQRKDHVQNGKSLRRRHDRTAPTSLNARTVVALIFSVSIRNRVPDLPWAFCRHYELLEYGFLFQAQFSPMKNS